MLKKMMAAAGVLALATAAFAAEKLSDREIKARFYYDLGAEQVDVSGYPRAQRDNYKLFADKCSQCHTLARPINSPLTKAADWKRFVTRMHARVENSSKSGFTATDAKKIIDFLAFDSKIRKVDHKADFAKEAAGLRARFAVVKTERTRLRAEEDRTKIKEPINENAQPTPRP